MTKFPCINVSRSWRSLSDTNSEEQAQLSVLRSALIFPQQGFAAEVQRHKFDLPNHSRLLGGASICAHAARSVVTQSLQLADSGLRSTLLSVTPTFLAAVVLALSILRQPNSRLARSDIELLASATEYVESWFLQRGFNATFTQTCVHLRTRVISVHNKTGGGGRARPIGETRTSTETGTAEENHQRWGTAELIDQVLPTPGMETQDGAGAEGMGQMGMTDPNTELFGGLEFEDLWNMMDADFIMYDENQFIAP